MSEPKLDLDKLERLERKATPGPWRWADDYKTTRGETTYTLAGYQDMSVLSCDGIFNAPLDCDEVFIVALRNAAPALFAELRTLRARVAELERDLDACRVELLEAQHAVGEAWFAGGATLAEAIERKCRALEDEVEGWELAARGWP